MFDADDSHRRGITLVGLLTLIAILGMLLVLLLPALQYARESARRAACINNLGQIGLALYKHHDVHGEFPASNDVPLLKTPGNSWRDIPLHKPAEPDPSVGPPEHGTNISWLWRIAPYFSTGDDWIQFWVRYSDPVNVRAWDTGNPVDRNTLLPTDPDQPCHQMYWMTPIQYFKCPSFTGGDFCQANSGAGVRTNPYDPSTPYGPAALTNYVALGATHSDSLLGVETNRLAGGDKHPNGAIYPGQASSLRDIRDGTTGTIYACETREVTLSAWFEGSTAAVFGLVGSPTFVLEDQNRTPGGTFGTPAEGTTTTINFGNGRLKPVRYYLADGPQGVPWLHGPSSFHPGVVNHLMGDGSVRSVIEEIPPHLYMWLITRESKEPIPGIYDTAD